MSTKRDKLATLCYVLLGLALLYSLGQFILPSWFWHPLVPGKGYNSWSGIFGSFLTSVPQWLIAGLLIARHHNCHHKGCWSIGHRHPKFGWPACRDHWHEMPDHIDPVKHAEEHGLSASDDTPDRGVSHPGDESGTSASARQ